MKKVRKLEIPFERAFLERQLISAGQELNRFSLGQEEQGSSCIFVPCADDIMICVPGDDGITTPLYHFNANDPGGDDLFWVGLLPNQGGSPGAGAEGSSWYFFKSSSPTEWAGTFAIGPEVSLTITGYVSASAGRALKIGFFDSSQTIGGTGNNSNLISSTQLKAGPVPQWTAFSVTLTTPIGTASWALGKDGSSVSFDEIRVSSTSAPSGPTCSIYTQDGEVNVISGSNVPLSVITASLVASGSYTVFGLPITASDVSGVWIDQLPTDVWDFDPDENTIILPTEVLPDTRILVRYMT